MAGATEFLLEIEQRMTGDNVVGELQALENEFTSASKRLADFESAGLAASKGLEKVGAQLESARNKMAAAMSDGDEKAFWKAAAAADALAKKQAELQAKAVSAKGAFDQEAKSISAMADQIGALKKKEDAESKAGQGGDDDVNVAKAAKGLKMLGGPLAHEAGLVSKLAKGWKLLSGEFGTGGAMAIAGAVGVLALAAAVVAVAAAFAYGVVKIGLWAAGLANAYRDQKVTLEAITGSAAAADKLSDSMSDLERTTGVTTDRQVELVRELKAAHVAAENMPAALKAITMQESALGDTSGTQALIDQLGYAGANAGQLADKIDKKFGGVVEERMLGLDQQIATLHHNIGDIFGGLNIEGFLRGFSKIVGLFDSSTASGQALKTVFETLFQPLFDHAEDFFTLAEAGFLKLEIAVLKAGIIIKNMLAGVDTGALKEIWDMLSPTILSGMESALSSYVTGWVAFIQILIWITDVFTGAWNAGKALGDMISDLSKGDFSFLDKFKDIGNDIINGLVDAITAGAARVSEAVTNVADTAITAAKNKLKIRSPSQVFAEIGFQTSEGFAQGVDDGGDKAGSALDRLVDAPDAKKGSSSSSSKSVTVGQIVLTGVKDGAEAMSKLEDSLIQLLDGHYSTADAEAT